MSAVVALAAGIAGAVPTENPAADRACSIEPYSVPPGASTTYFIATALVDTMEAGMAPPELADADPRPLFGQLVRVVRSGGFASQEMAGQEVLLVPWGYGADCKTERWSQSARWTEPGVTALYRARLRDRDRWASERPTFDVGAAWYEPYPHTQMRLRQSEEERLTADELFDLYRALPPSRLQEEDDWYAPMVEWAAGHPELAQRYPATTMLRFARAMLERARVRAIASPVAGTWRLEISLFGAPAGSLYLRTNPRPMRPWYARARREASPEGVSGQPGDGHYIRAYLAPEPDGVNVTWWGAGRTECRGELVLVHEPVRAGARDTTWAGTLDPGLVARCLQGEEAAGLVGRAVLASWRNGGGVPDPGGRFHRGPDGEIAFEETWIAGADTLLTIHGRRISTETLAERP